MAAFHHEMRTILAAPLRFTLSRENIKVDIVGALPLDVSLRIFRLLDSDALFAAMRVSRTWNGIYNSDGNLVRCFEMASMLDHWFHDPVICRRNRELARQPLKRVKPLRL
jgi:hypothetical protein